MKGLSPRLSNPPAPPVTLCPQVPDTPASPRPWPRTHLSRDGIRPPCPPSASPLPPPALRGAGGAFQSVNCLLAPFRSKPLNASNLSGMKPDVLFLAEVLGHAGGFPHGAHLDRSLDAVSSCRGPRACRPLRPQLPEWPLLSWPSEPHTAAVLTAGPCPQPTGPRPSMHLFCFGWNCPQCPA